MTYIVRVTTGEVFPVEIMGHQLNPTDATGARNPAFDNTLRLATADEIDEIKAKGFVSVRKPTIDAVATMPTPEPAVEFEPEHIPAPTEGEPELEPAAEVMARVAAMNETELRARAKDLGIENADRTPEAALRGKVKKAELAAREPVKVAA